MDDRILGTLEKCEEYAVSKQKCIELLRSGYFQMALARKSGSRISVEDCRPELIATSRIRTTESPNVSHELQSTDSNAAAILSVSGLPHRNLKNAQANFLSSLQELVKQANLVAEITAAATLTNREI